MNTSSEEYSGPNGEEIAAAASLIRQADFLLITAGAGMGVDSGLPDFRGPQGFWGVYPALRQAGLDFSAIASPEAFRTQPQRAWGFYGHRLKLYRNTLPNRAFSILQRWGESMANGYGVFTSNVDGHFQAAGFPESGIVECHGSLQRLQCTRPCSNATWPADGFDPVTDDEQCLLTGSAPVCPHCGALARPNVLMFGDFDWNADVTERQHARLIRRLAEAERPVVIEIGAGTAIPSVRRFSEMVAERPGGRLVRINMKEASVPSSRDIGIAAGGLATVLAIDALGVDYGRCS